MAEYVCCVVRVDDGAVISRHSILATELDGDLVEIATPDLPAEMPPRCVLITGLPEDVTRLFALLQNSSGARPRS